jgi:hypothetical protein
MLLLLRDMKTLAVMMTTKSNSSRPRTTHGLPPKQPAHDAAPCYLRHALLATIEASMQQQA